MKLKFIIYIILLSTIFFSCSKESSENELTESGDRLWPPTVYSIKKESEVELKMNFLQNNLMLLNYIVLHPEKLEIFQAEGKNDDFKKIASFQNDIPSSFKVSGLKKDVPYFFYIKTHHRDVNSKTSQTIMTIPSSGPDFDIFADIKDTWLSSPSFNSSNEKLAYCNTNFTWDNGNYGAHSIFLYDTKKQTSELVEISSKSPKWVNGQDKIIYLSDNGEANIDNYIPQHVSCYEVNSKKIIRLTSGRNFNINPAVSNAGTHIVYGSDAGQKGKFDLWKMKIDGKDKEKIKTLNYENIYSSTDALGVASWSKNDKFIYYGLVSSEESQNGIFKLDLASKQATKVFETIWNDISPSISPDDMHVAFISNRSGLNEIWTYDLINKKFKQITSFDLSLDFFGSNLEWVSNRSFILSALKKDENTGRTIAYKINF